MSLRDPAADLRDFLAGKVAGGLALVAGTNLYAGRLLVDDLSPGQAVFLLHTGGPPSTPYMGPERAAYYQAAVQVLVRGPPGSHQAGAAVARGVFELLHMATVPGYVQVLARDSGPVYLDTDTTKRGIWAVNVEAHYTTALP